MELSFENYWIIGNKFPKDREDIFTEKIKALNDPKIKLLGYMPNDMELMKYNLLGNNLLNLPDNNTAYIKAKELFRKLI